MELFDLHCDTPFRCFTEKKDFLKNDLDISFEKAGCFSKWSQIFAVWVREETPSPFEFYKSVLSDFKSKLVGCEYDHFTPLFSIEGGSVIEEIDYLDEIKNDGVSVITLTWNSKNKIASGANEKGGLTLFGEAVIKKMNCLKIATDLSHLNEESFFDAITVTDYPIATHSCSKSVFNHKRNLSDEALIKIAQKGGIVGICPYPEFSGKNSFQSVYDNLCYMLSLGLENHIAFGSDFDGAQMSDELLDISYIPLLRAYLLEKGVSERHLNLFFYENAGNFFRNI